MFNPSRHAEVAIVGAGAAGLFAAIFAGREAPGGTVVAFDGAAKLGAKILIAGGGRCNVTHDVVTPADYAGHADRGATTNAIKKVLRSFTVQDTIDFFRGRGVELKREETGKLFPVTDRARSVLNALLEAAYEVEARLLTDHRVTAIERNPDGFTVTTFARQVHRQAGRPVHRGSGATEDRQRRLRLSPWLTRSATPSPTPGRRSCRCCSPNGTGSPDSRASPLTWSSKLPSRTDGLSVVKAGRC